MQAVWTGDPQMPSFAERKQMHLTTLMRELKAVAHNSGFPGHCSAGMDGRFCRTFINGQVANAERNFSRFLGSDHYSSSQLYGRYMMFYNQKLQRCRQEAINDPIQGSMCFSRLDDYARFESRRPPLQTVTDITPSNQAELDAARERARSSRNVGTDAVRRFLPGRSTYKPFTRPQIRTMPLPEDVAVSKRVPRKKAIPTRVEPEPTPRPDIRIVNTGPGPNRPDIKIVPGGRGAEASEAPPKPDTSALPETVKKDNTNIYLAAGAVGIVALFLALRKK